MMEYDDIVFGFNEDTYHNKCFALVIYDISNNKKRKKLSDLLLGYGFRIQKSAFEAMISKSKMERLKEALALFGSEGDSIRLYEIEGVGKVTEYGNNETTTQEDVIVY